jgi:RNA polymerase sigma-70 factor (ECF subfamily)
MEDAAAVAHARAGDKEAFRLLVERHSHALFRLAHRMTGNEHDAEDVVQEALVKAFRSLDQFEERSSVGSWLYRITSNCAFDLLRARQRQGRLIGDGDPEDAMRETRSPEPGPDRLAASKEIRAKVGVALARMSARERSAFVLRHFEGRPLQEIGESLGMDLNATKQSILRAVRKVRLVLRPLVEEATP